MTDQAQFTNHISNSQTIIGLILAGKQSPFNFSPERLIGDYGKMLSDIQRGSKMEDLIPRYGNNTIQICRHAAQSVNGLGTELDWAQILNDSYMLEIVSDELNKAQKFLHSGEKEKALDIIRRANTTMVDNQRMKSVAADEISDDYTPFIQSGSTVWDTHIGGIPAVGTVILGAKTYTGKTTVAISSMECYLRQYPDRDILFVTLEDMNEGWKDRAKVILGEKNKAFWHRVKVMEFADKVDDIITEAMRYEDVGAIYLDYVDYMAEESSLEAYKEIYRKLSMGAKQIAASNKFRQMTIFCLAQFGKGSYKGGVPTINALMYTGEQFAYQIVYLYSPTNDFYSDDSDNPFTLPVVPKKAYLVWWKVKNGCRPHSEEFPGAIQVNHSPKYGYDLMDENSSWFPLTAETRREVKKKK